MARDVDKPSQNQMPKANPYHLAFLCRIFVCEMFGSGFLCFMFILYQPGITGTIPVPVVVGLTFAWLVWVLGPLSGGVINPVAALMLFLTRRITIVHAIVHIVAQFLGAIIGSYIGRAAGPSSFDQIPDLGMTVVHPSITTGQAVLLEIIITTLLLFTILGTNDEFRATPWAQGHVTIFPLAFGITKTLLASLAGTFTGASMNPARSLAPAIMNNNFKDLWVYFVGPIAGAIIGTLIYELILSDGASVPRLKALISDPEFDRKKDYKRPIAEDFEVH